MEHSSRGKRALGLLIGALAALSVLPVACLSAEQCEVGASGDSDCAQILGAEGARCELGTCVRPQQSDVSDSAGAPPVDAQTSREDASDASFERDAAPLEDGAPSGDLCRLYTQENSVCSRDAVSCVRARDADGALVLPSGSGDGVVHFDASFTRSPSRIELLYKPRAGSVGVLAVVLGFDSSSKQQVTSLCNRFTPPDVGGAPAVAVLVWYTESGAHVKLATSCSEVPSGVQPAPGGELRIAIDVVDDSVRARLGQEEPVTAKVDARLPYTVDLIASGMDEFAQVRALTFQQRCEDIGGPDASLGQLDARTEELADL